MIIHHDQRKRKRNNNSQPPFLVTLVAVVTLVYVLPTRGALVSAFQSPSTISRGSIMPFKPNESSGSFHNLSSRIVSTRGLCLWKKQGLTKVVMNSNLGDTEAVEDQEAKSESSLPSDTTGIATDDNWKIPSWAMLALPLLSGIFPFLLQTAKSLPPNSTEQWTVVSLLFVGNRLYLYALSGTIVALAALRGSADSSFLGQRIVDLTEELLYRPSLESKSSNSGTMTMDSLKTDLNDPIAGEEITEEKPAMIEALRQSGLDTSLDQITGETQAILLPVFITLSLATSVVLLPLWTGGGGDLTSDNGLNLFSGFLNDQQELISKILPKLSEIWNFGLLTMFTRSEVRRLMQEVTPKGWMSEDEGLGENSQIEESDSGLNPLVVVEWASAIAITSAAFFSRVWQAQNFVNMALAILVARAIQLDRLTVVLGALSLLTIYDATSVFLVPAAMATDLSANLDPINTVGTTATLASTATTNLASDSSILVATASDPAGSAMGSVAIQKLTSASFQPGLLTTRIGNDNRLGGSLGLGDAVFPSLLAILTRRFDLEQMKNRIEEDTDKGKSLFAASLGGYFLGCFACEFAPLISTSGIPALVFIVPSMVASVFLAASLSGQLGDFLEFAPNSDIQSEK